MSATLTARAGVYHVTLTCGYTRIVVGRYALLWCSRCWQLHPWDACESRPA